MLLDSVCGDIHSGFQKSYLWSLSLGSAHLGVGHYAHWRLTMHQAVCNGIMTGMWHRCCGDQMGSMYKAPATCKELNHCWARFLPCGPSEPGLPTGCQKRVACSFGYLARLEPGNVQYFEGSVRAHCLPRSQRPIFQPSCWPVCNPLVSFVAMGSSWPSSTCQPFWEWQWQHCWGVRPQDTELMSSGYLGVSLPGHLDILLTGLTDTWDQKGEWARRSATVNAKHQERVNCVNQCSDQVFHEGRNVYACLKYNLPSYTGLPHSHWLRSVSVLASEKSFLG